MPTALVTGGASGLGLEIAKGLARRGMDVELTDVDADAAHAEAAAISGANGAGLDVTDAVACEQAAETIVERTGSLDVWVNNAGILHTGSVWDLDADARRSLFDVNAHGTMNGTLAALEPMRTAGRGQVINIISLAGLAVPPGESIYAATKHAALAFSIGAHADLRRAGYKGINVSAVCPDGIWTPMLRHRLDDPHAAPSFSGQLLRAEDVAARVIALLDRPKIVVAIPPWRGVFARTFAAFPRAAAHATPLFIADARRRQQRWRKRIESGRLP